MSDRTDPPNAGAAHVRPKRSIRLPTKYSDYVDSDTVVEQLLVLGDDELSLPVDNNLSFYSAIRSVASTDALLCSIQDNDATDPPNISEAKKSKYWTEWLSAIHKELESLKSKGVYEEVDRLPPGRKAVQCKWVLHIKRDKDGTISRFKARLVAKGFTQIPSQDFTCTFAPVARWDFIRSLLCIAATHDYCLWQLDVKSAYLNGPLEEEIYMKAPDSFNSSAPFWLLNKAFMGCSKPVVSGISPCTKLTRTLGSPSAVQIGVSTLVICPPLSLRLQPGSTISLSLLTHKPNPISVHVRSTRNSLPQIAVRLSGFSGVTSPDVVPNAYL